VEFNFEVQKIKVKPAEIKVSPAGEPALAVIISFQAVVLAKDLNELHTLKSIESGLHAVFSADQMKMPLDGLGISAVPEAAGGPDLVEYKCGECGALIEVEKDKFPEGWAVDTERHIFQCPSCKVGDDNDPDIDSSCGE